MVVELSKIRCSQCGGFMLEHPEEKVRDIYVKCNCCGWTRPTHYSKASTPGEVPKKVREKNGKNK